eukprot:TRINITY_DN1138_c0_g1_i4.p1 TRINITY_DN1138_c0_g1~~TRINITY_DN1138_c0_g1_i4.p1  ORF type:complete len:210 (-),score=13.40 TRINITY_DN1138_c0_g1_i4:748-1377(-)
MGDAFNGLNSERILCLMLVDNQGCLLGSSCENFTTLGKVNSTLANGTVIASSAQLRVCLANSSAASVRASAGAWASLSLNESTMTHVVTFTFQSECERIVITFRKVNVTTCVIVLSFRLRDAHAPADARTEAADELAKHTRSCADDAITVPFASVELTLPSVVKFSQLLPSRHPWLSTSIRQRILSELRPLKASPIAFSVICSCESLRR